MTDEDLVVNFLSRIAGDLYSGNGVKVGMSDLGVVSAGKRISWKGRKGAEVLCRAFVKLETQHPEILDVLMTGFDEMVKERIRRAAGRSAAQDTTTVS